MGHRSTGLSSSDISKRPTATIHLAGIVSLSFDEIASRCQECRKVQGRREYRSGAGPWETRFPAQCGLCGDGTEVVALVPIAVGCTEDHRQWRVRVLEDGQIERAREEGVTTAVCPMCSEQQEGYEWGIDDVVSEIHLPALCLSCGVGTVVIALEPILVSRSHDDREWYVTELDEEEIELLRHRVDPWRDDWRLD